MLKIPVSAKLVDMQARPLIGQDAGYACNCIGPQDGKPCCPCQMRSVQIKDGRYVRIQDLGPAPSCLSQSGICDPQRP